MSSSHAGELLVFPGERGAVRTTALSANALQYFQQGLARLQEGQSGPAVVLLQQSVEMAPTFAEARIFLGIAHSLSCEIYPAIAQYALAQLYFKLRIVEKGYERAGFALRCVTNIEQRKMLTQLLREEKVRERNGIPRPSFNKPFSTPALVIAGSGLALAVMAILVHLH